MYLEFRNLMLGNRASSLSAVAWVHVHAPSAMDAINDLPVSLSALLVLVRAGNTVNDLPVGLTRLCFLSYVIA